MVITFITPINGSNEEENILESIETNKTYSFQDLAGKLSNLAEISFVNQVDRDSRTSFNPRSDRNTISRRVFELVSRELNSPLMTVVNSMESLLMDHTERSRKSVLT